MPVGLAQDPQVDLDRLDAGAASLPVGAGAAYGQTFLQAADPRPALSYLQNLGRGISDAYAGQAGEAPVTPPKIDADQANAQYGLQGYLRFNQPTYEDDAAFLSAQARERQFNDTLLAHSNANPLLNFGTGLAGSLVNPANVGIMALTDGFAPGALEAVGLRGTGEAVSTLGRVANVVGEGALAQVPFIAANYGLAQYDGEDYGAGDALRDIAAGAILHTTVHAALRGAASLAGRLDAPGGGADVVPGAEGPEATAPAETPNVFTPDPVPAAGVPPEVDALPPEVRRGAFALALEQSIDDRPVDVGQYVARELEPPNVARLDEAEAQPAIDSWRPIAEGDDTAVTTRGTEVPVSYGLAELGDLTTSHDDDLNVNPAYPAELQPRARERAGAQARNYQLESELNPKLLMGDVGAGAGAPIVAPDGVVESGNGRTIALRRSAAAGGEAYARYRAELQAQGYDVAGMDKPVLVRMRTQPMEGAARAALAREMNADVTERMSATEQAMADAHSLDDAALSHLQGDDVKSRRAFARAFLQRVAPDVQNSLVAADGALSKVGQDRIDAALVAKAYGDPRLVEALFETADPNIKTIGKSLKDAAPVWAIFRAAVARGEVPAELDVTEALRSAVDLVRYARDEKIAVGQLIAERLDQLEMFGGDAISPETEAFLRLFFRDEGFTRPLGADKLTTALEDYARQALKVQPGPNLFGDVAGEDTARQILSNVADRFRRGDAGDLDLRPPGRAAEPEGDAARPVVIDLREPGRDGDGRGRGVSPDGEQGAGEPGAEPGADAGDAGAAGPEPEPQRATGDALIAADPELRALAEDTQRLADDNGLTVETPDNQKPDNLAEAIRAAAVCLLGEGL